MSILSLIESQSFCNQSCLTFMKTIDSKMSSYMSYQANVVCSFSNFLVLLSSLCIAFNSLNSRNSLAYNSVSTYRYALDGYSCDNKIFMLVLEIQSELHAHIS